MIKSIVFEQIRFILKPLSGMAVLVAVAGLSVFFTFSSAIGYERYNDGCMLCHGKFTEATSPKGTVFPSGNKHEMHRGSDFMNTACDLCHSSGDAKNPFTGSSKGTAANPGLGCTGCHERFGLRAHHAAAGITCVGCHPSDGTPVAENVKPPYYGTADTNVDNPCNDVLAANTNENWSIGDFLGLDNDGDTLYDLADFDCGPPYRIVALAIEGNDVRITWETVGGRRDMVQASDDPSAGFSDVGTAQVIPGVGIVTRETVEPGAASNLKRFYKIRYAPAAEAAAPMIIQAPLPGGSEPVAGAASPFPEPLAHPAVSP